MIGKTLKIRGGAISKDNPVFREIALEILTSETSRIGSRAHQDAVRDEISRLVDQFC
jgi:hypothetical protein